MVLTRSQSKKQQLQKVHHTQQNVEVLNYQVETPVVTQINKSVKTEYVLTFPLWFLLILLFVLWVCSCSMSEQFYIK